MSLKEREANLIKTNLKHQKIQLPHQCQWHSSQLINLQQH